MPLRPAAGHALRRRLLRWYRANRRALPWRRTRDPYRILVAELMLQQTRVVVVVDRWRTFVARFPTIGALAAAREDDVLALWSGLGYYRRARNLHAAARTIRDRHGGAVPAAAATLRTLPGIGPYTAAAVSSIAFGRPEPLVDGNVARVLSRLFRLRGDPRAGRPAKRLQEIAAALVPHDGTAGDFNQALMELGALVCLPLNPGCPRCPLRVDCGARRSGRPEAYPERIARPAVVRETRVRAAIERRGRWLVRRAGPGETPAGLFEFPVLGDVGGSPPPAAVRAAVLRASGLAVDLVRDRGTFRHGILQRSITERLFSMRASGGRLGSGGESRWVTLSGLRALPLSAASMRILEIIGRRGCVEAAIGRPCRRRSSGSR